MGTDRGVRVRRRFAGFWTLIHLLGLSILLSLPEGIAPPGVTEVGPRVGDIVGLIVRIVVLPLLTVGAGALTWWWSFRGRRRDAWLAAGGTVLAALLTTGWAPFI